MYQFTNSHCNNSSYNYYIIRWYWYKWWISVLNTIYIVFQFFYIMISFFSGECVNLLFVRTYKCTGTIFYIYKTIIARLNFHWKNYHRHQKFNSMSTCSFLVLLCLPKREQKKDTNWPWRPPIWSRDLAFLLLYGFAINGAKFHGSLGGAE